MSLFHWVIVLIIAIIVVGGGRMPRLAEDFAKAIKAFKSGMRDEDTTAVEKRDLPPQAPTGAPTEVRPRDPEPPVS